MGTSINDFARIIGRTPAPAEELIRGGAYPYATSSRSWAEIKRELLEPILEGYFERTRYFSPDVTIPEEQDTLPGYFLTGEWNYAQTLPKIANTGDVYIGVNRALNSTFAAWAGVDHAFGVDIDRTIPFGFLPLWNLLLAVAPSRVHFVALALGRPLRSYPSEHFEEVSGEQIVKWVEARSYNSAYSMSLRRILASIIEAASGVRGAEHLALMSLEKLLSTPHELFKLAQTNAQGQGGLLSSEEAYRRERDLFLQGRMTGVLADLATTGINKLFGVLKAMDLSLGLLYLSNVEQWIFELMDIGEDDGRAWKFYKNLQMLQKISEGNPLVISSIDVHRPVVYGLGEYLGMSIPFGVGKEYGARLAHQYFALRQSVIRYWFTKNESPRHALGFVNDDVEGVPARLVRDARRVIPDVPMPEGLFHRAMFKESDTYRNSTREEQRMFRLNMIALGVVVRAQRPASTAGATIITGRAPHEEAPQPAAGRGGYLAGGGRHQSPMELAPSMPLSVMQGLAPITASMAPMTNMLVGGMTVSKFARPF